MTLATTYWLKSPKYDPLQVQHRWRGAKDDRARGRRPHRRRRDRRTQVCEHLPTNARDAPCGPSRAYSPRVGSLTAGAGHSANSSGGCLRVDLRSLPQRASSQLRPMAQVRRSPLCLLIHQGPHGVIRVQGATFLLELTSFSTSVGTGRWSASVCRWARTPATSLAGSRGLGHFLPP